MKKDSTGICFIGKRKFKSFLKKYLPEKPGVIKSIDGQNLGFHEGLMYYTLGQRKGLGIGGIKNKLEKPWFVAKKNMKQNILFVTQDKKHHKLMSNSIIITKYHWINKKYFKKKLLCSVKTRYRQKDNNCLVNFKKDKNLTVTFEKPICSVNPGQSAVFYISDHCLGGGIIESYQNI